MYKCNYCFISFNFTVSTTYVFGTNGGLIKMALAESDWLRTDRDELSLGFITNSDDAVLVRVDSSTSDDFLEMEVVCMHR